MMSRADTTSHGKKVVSELQSAGAKGEDFTGSRLTREGLDDAGLGRDGVEKGGFGAQMQSDVDKAGVGGKVKAALQHVGAKK